MKEYLVFKMPNCSPCVQLTPIMEEFINVTFINALEDFELALKYNIRKAPTVIILQNGEEIGRFSGVKTKAEIEELI